MSAKRKKKRRTAAAVSPVRPINFRRTIEHVLTTWADRELRRLFGVPVPQTPAPRKLINVTPKPR
jgi:hypothetical protein